MDLVAATRSLRRRVAFWRRAVWLLLGAAVIFAAILWNRGESHRRECYKSLDHFAKLAQHMRLSEAYRGFVEQQWQTLDPGNVRIGAIHYALITNNWLLRVQPGESIPLAVCREPHASLFGKSRHVLFRETTGDRIEWMDDEQAQPYAVMAARSSGGSPAGN
jgi:hypothetical protein